MLLLVAALTGKLGWIERLQPSSETSSLAVLLTGELRQGLPEVVIAPALAGVKLSGGIEELTFEIPEEN